MCCAELPWIFVWRCTEKDHDALFSCIQAFNGCNFAHRTATNHEKGKQHASKLSLGIADDGSTKRVLDDGGLQPVLLPLLLLFAGVIGCPVGTFSMRIA